MALLNGARPHVADPFTFWAFNVVVASFAVVPGAASATSIAAGVIYGTPLGVALVGSSCAVGAGVSFIIARYAARPIVEKIFLRGDENPGGSGSAVSAYKFAALDQAVMRDGAQIVLLTRLSPLSPYVAMSFAFGLTAVDFAPYMAASAVGILPASTLYVYLGDTGRRAAGSGTGAGTSKLEMAFYAFGLAVTALVTVRITRLANDALGAKTGAGGSNQSTPREGRARRDSAAAAAAARPSAANLWGLPGSVGSRRTPVGTLGRSAGTGTIPTSTATTTRTRMPSARGRWRWRSAGAEWTFAAATTTRRKLSWRFRTPRRRRTLRVSETAACFWCRTRWRARRLSGRLPRRDETP